MNKKDLIKRIKGLNFSKDCLSAFMPYMLDTKSNIKRTILNHISHIHAIYVFSDTDSGMVLINVKLRKYTWLGLGLYHQYIKRKIKNLTLKYGIVSVRYKIKVY
jgi:hypothetical protein